MPKPQQQQEFSIAAAADQLPVKRQYLYKLIAENRLHPRTRKKSQNYMTQADIDELRARLWGSGR
jgi:hypothetical protein